ncbi:MAG: MbnP family copper-binding protein [Nannocystaceae bacterium]|nr:metallo-mystery pair system four-Cys motif protein [bacterium]
MKTFPWLLLAALAVPAGCDSGGGDDGGDTDTESSTGTTDSTDSTNPSSSGTTSPGTTTDESTTGSTSVADTGSGSESGSSSGEGSSSTGEAVQDITLQFAARVGDAEANCTDSYPEVGSNAMGTESYTVTFRDLRFYISDIVLIDSDDNEVALDLDQDSPWQHEGVALLDFEDGSGACESGTAETNAQVVGTVAEGDYTGIRFQIGVPFDLNHTDVNTAEPPLNDVAMNWNWLNGRKFVKIEVNTDNSLEGAGSLEVDQWNVHLGAICPGDDPTMPPGSEDDCIRPGRPQVALSDFDPANDVLVADVGALLDGVNIEEDLGAMPVIGCQSLPPADNNTIGGVMVTDCDDLWANWGMDWSTGDCADDCSGQTFFSVEAGE